MAIVELFSKRQKKLRGDVPDVYVYDDLPQPLRVQIVHILTDTLGGKEEYEYWWWLKSVDQVLSEYRPFSK